MLLKGINWRNMKDFVSSFKLDAMKDMAKNIDGAHLKEFIEQLTDGQYTVVKTKKEKKK